MSIKVNNTDIKAVTFNNTIDKIIINGTEVWTSLPEWDSRGLNYNSWDTIQKWIQAGKFAQKVSVGDTKTFRLNNKTYTAEVVSINTGGSWYPSNTVDFIAKELYATIYSYNSTNINTGGFPSSALRDILNNTIYPLLEYELKAVIIDKSHSYISNQSGSMTTIATKLWLPTRYEVAGNTNYSAAGETAANNKKYTLYTLTKYLNGKSIAEAWWLGSMYTTNSDSFWVAGEYNTLSSRGAGVPYGVPICFRIG